MLFKKRVPIRERIQGFLELELGTSKEEEIVGKIDIERLSDLINEIDEF
jgi:hypothetical protein